MKKSKYKIGEPIIIEFLDHCEFVGSDEFSPLPCIVCGFLSGEDDRCYYVCSWMSNEGFETENSDHYAILKAAITKIFKLETKRGK